MAFVEESRLLAQSFFQSQPRSAQLQAMQLFQSLDRTGRGFLTHQELLDSPLAPFLRLHSSARLAELFQMLDADRNGVLDFEECMTLYYLLTVRTRSCRNCGACILKMGYTCTVCWELRGSADATYDLCRECFSLRSFSHPHTNFVDEHQMYNIMLITTFRNSQQVQCKICGEHHSKNSPSFLLKDGDHVTKDTKDTDRFICEWCLNWRCSKCGVFFKGQICSARQGQWLAKSRYCHRCGGFPKRKLDLESLLEELKSRDTERNCDTCRIKLRTGAFVAIQSSSSKKKGVSDSGSSSSVGMMDVLNNGLRSVEIGGQFCNTIVQKNLCPLM